MASTINGTSTGSGGLISTGDDSGILNIQTNETTAITVDTSQNVGIGATSLSDKFTVGDGTVSADATVRINGGSNTGKGSGIRLMKAGTAYAYIGSTSWLLGTGTSSNLSLSTTGNPDVNLDASGNLLVGTTSNVSSAKVNIAQGSSNGVMYQMMQFTGGSGTGGNEVGEMKRQTTMGVANSATTILSSMTFGELITVTGAGSGAIFADLLMGSYNTIAVISSNTQQGGPASRTYSVSSGALRLTMGSATAMDITVQSIITGARGA